MLLLNYGTIMDIRAAWANFQQTSLVHGMMDLFKASHLRAGNSVNYQFYPCSAKIFVWILVHLDNVSALNPTKIPIVLVVLEGFFTKETFIHKINTNNDDSEVLKPGYFHTFPVLCH